MSQVRRMLPGPRQACALFSLLFFAALLPGVAKGQNAKPLTVTEGEHISIIGNTLPDRMQHDGWLETYLYARFPEKKLVFRNLGFSGDELTLRLRSANFGSPDQWLSKTNTDTVFAFFGYNESYEGKDGLDKFRKDLDNFLKHTKSQKYNGKTNARVVLFSPIAHEDLKNPNLPNGKENNKRLALYTKAMAEVAQANDVPFVDLFNPSQELYSKSKAPLTINGVHLNTLGNQMIAQVIDTSLFGKQPAVSSAKLENIRRAVLDKNFYWFNRYRTTDGYSIYGGRAGLRFVGGQTNKVVMDREMEILDAMTAIRDRNVWAVAQGQAFKIDDTKTPDFIPVETNKPGPLPGGRHVFLTGKESLEKMKLGKDLKVTLFASEEQFPELINPVQMAFDTKGRLWVAAWPTYPHWKPKNEMNDKLLIFEDTDGDGQADKMKVFADNLHNPTGFEFYNGGVLVSHAPDLIFLKDTDGDDKADFRETVLSGIDSADTHHTANSFTFDHGGALYFQEGTFHHTQVETPWGPPVRSANAGVFRYEPRTSKFDVYVNFGFANPHGHVFDRWGQDIVVDGTGAVPYHGTLFSGQTADFRQRHGRPPTVYRQKTRPCSGLEILSSRHFPDDMQNDLLVPNVIGFLGILRYKIEDDGASIKGIEQEPIIQSSDPNFRPTDLEIGPDGALYFTDWQNPIIGHMQHNLRDPSRDNKHGRIYKVMHTKRPLLKPVAIDGEPIGKLLDLLKEPEDRVRSRARIELSERDSSQVIAELQKWVRKLDSQDKNYQHHLMEALWLHQWHNVVNEPLLRRMLQSPDFHARAAATRVLCYWRDRVQNPLGLLRKQINDNQPRVRLEAIRALSFFHEEEALAVALELLTHPEDQYLRYTFNETLNTLERRLGSGRLNRENIAASLVNLLNKGNVPPEQKLALIETICRHGGPKELQTIWDMTIRGSGYPSKARPQVLAWLVDAANIRNAKPNVQSELVRELLKGSTENPELLRSAINLTTAWKVNQAIGDLRGIATSNKVDQESRYAAIESLAQFADAESKATLNQLTKESVPTDVRFRAAVALAKLDLRAGAMAGAKALADAKQTDDPAYVVEGFLLRKNGASKLGEALAKQEVSEDTAKRILRAMYLAGRNEPGLADVVSKFAKLDADIKPPTPQQVIDFVKAVNTSGDAARGEKVFRRADLGCVKCHGINKAGGNIGPDLGAIGGTSPVDYIVTSVLDPSSSIKEEYITKSFVTASGSVISGIVVERNKNRVVVKDATGKITQVPVSEIDEEFDGKSLMPEGITRILTKAELLDLIRFVSELGKPGPYAIPSTSTVRTWKVLRNVPDALKEGVPNRDLVRDYLLAAPAEAWEIVYGKVNGALPLNEVHKTGNILYLQGEIQVLQGGPIEVKLQSNDTAMFWIDEEPFEGKKSSAVVDLAPGRHKITVRVVLGETKAPELRLELNKTGDSRANFELVNAQ